MKPTIHIFEDRWIFGIRETAEDILTPVQKAFAQLAVKHDCIFADSNTEQIKSLAICQKKLALIEGLTGPNILLFDLQYDNPALRPIIHPDFDSIKRRIMPGSDNSEKECGPPREIRNPIKKVHALFLIHAALLNDAWFGHIRIVSGAGPQAENQALIAYLFEKLNRRTVSFSYSTVDDLKNAPVGEVEAAISEFKQAQGSQRARLLPYDAREWFAVENGKSKHSIMKHDWHGAEGVVKSGKAQEAKKLLSQYFARILVENETCVNDWVQKLEVSDEIDPLYQNLKWLVGGCSKLHGGDDAPYCLNYPVLAVVLAACSPTPFLWLVNVKWPAGRTPLTAASRTSGQSALSLFDALVKLFKAFSEGDKGESAGKCLIVSPVKIETGRFEVIFNIPHESLLAAIEEARKMCSTTMKPHGTSQSFLEAEEQLERLSDATLRIQAHGKLTQLIIECKTAKP